MRIPSKIALAASTSRHSGTAHSLGEGVCVEIVLQQQMDMDPGHILLEDLRVSDVAGGKVTVITIAVEAWGIQEVSMCSFSRSKLSRSAGLSPMRQWSS